MNKPKLTELVAKFNNQRTSEDIMSYYPGIVEVFLNNEWVSLDKDHIAIGSTARIKREYEEDYKDE